MTLINPLLLEPRTPQSPPPEPTATPETDAVPGSSISTLSDFTIAGTSDDEFTHDPTVISPRDTFYLDDGNVEVLCGSTLFCVHAVTVSFHSAVLSAKSNLATAGSPNDCPRILSSDMAMDFATLLKAIYPPGVCSPTSLQINSSAESFTHRLPDQNKVPDFITFSSLLPIAASTRRPPSSLGYSKSSATYVQ